MLEQKKFIVSHAPFLHNGSSISLRNYNIILATLPAVFFGLFQYGMPAVGVVSLSVSTAILWELLMNRITKARISIADGNAALIGLLLGMLLPPVSPWWLVITGTFIAIIVGKQIYGGIGGNPFHPTVIALAILMLSWKDLKVSLHSFFKGHSPGIDGISASLPKFFFNSSIIPCSLLFWV